MWSRRCKDWANTDSTRSSRTSTRIFSGRWVLHSLVSRLSCAPPLTHSLLPSGAGLPVANPNLPDRVCKCRVLRRHDARPDGGYLRRRRLSGGSWIRSMVLCTDFRRQPRSESRRHRPLRRRCVDVLNGSTRLRGSPASSRDFHRCGCVKSPTRWSSSPLSREQSSW